MQQHIRQGDVLLIATECNDQIGNIIAPSGGRLILVEGEATGHHHSIMATGNELYAACDGMERVYAADVTATDQMTILIGQLFVSALTPLDHQEHAAIDVEPGQYWVVQQRQYTPQAIERVLD